MIKDVLTYPEDEQKQIIAQYEAVRRGGQTNMFDQVMVQRIAHENEFYNLVLAIEDGAYSSILEHYGELISMLSPEDIPKAGRVRTSFSLEDPEDEEYERLKKGAAELEELLGEN